MKLAFENHAAVSARVHKFHIHHRAPTRTLFFYAFFSFNLVERPKRTRAWYFAESKVLGAILYKVIARYRAVFLHIL